VFAIGVTAFAADHKNTGVTFSGYAEGGYAYTWQSATDTKDSTLFLDSADIVMTANPSEKLKIVLDHAFNVSNTGTFAGAPAVGTLASTLGSPMYWGNAQFTVNNLHFAVLGAYLEYKANSTWTFTAGYFHTPFGMESMWNRYDMGEYYYSAGFTAANLLGWAYDPGLKVGWMGSKGGAELAVTDGRSVTAGTVGPFTRTTDLKNMPAASGKFWWEFKAGSWGITPVVSAYTGRFRGGPEDLGIGAGAMFKMGVINANLEYLMINYAPAPGATKVKMNNVYLEPSMDLGAFNIAAKAEWYNMDVGTGTSTSDWNFGASIGHEYDNHLRVRLAYQHQGISGNLGSLASPTGTGAHVNDFRLLIGTKW